MRVVTRLKTSGGGSLSDALAADLAANKLAFRNALARTARGLEKEIEGGLRGAGLNKLAPLMASRVYPDRADTGSLEALSVVFVKAGPVYQAAINAALSGATLRAHGGKYVLIPTEYNLVDGVNLAGKVRYTPRMMVESGAAFMLKRKGGPGYLWMLRVAEKLTVSRGGKRLRAVVSPALLRQVRAGNRRRTAEKGVAARQVTAMLNAGALPMYTMLPELVLKARLDAGGMIDKWAAGIGGLYEAEYRSIARG
jgi:hypothetical protein